MFCRQTGSWSGLGFTFTTKLLYHRHCWQWMRSIKTYNYDDICVRHSAVSLSIVAVTDNRMCSLVLCFECSASHALSAISHYAVHRSTDPWISKRLCSPRFADFNTNRLRRPSGAAIGPTSSLLPDAVRSPSAIGIRRARWTGLASRHFDIPLTLDRRRVTWGWLMRLTDDGGADGAVLCNIQQWTAVRSIRTRALYTFIPAVTCIR